MSLPDKCPFCGAGVLVLAGGFECKNGQCVTFDCRTWIHAGQTDERRTQSSTCEDAERARLAARVAELDARCKRLEEAARAVYLDSIASDHPWTEPEARNMRALRDVLEAKP